jgi:serine O-acetyltransferase
MFHVMGPNIIWWWSTKLFQKRLVFLARILKLVNYVAFRTILPYEVQLESKVTLWHRGLGTVVHPNVSIGKNVHIGHGVTIAGSSRGQMVIEDGVKIAAHAQIIPRRGNPITIARNSIVGAGAVVTFDVPEGATVVGNPARIL